MLTDQFIETEEKFGAHNYHPLDVVLTEGKGVWVYDVEGNRYLDCLSAYSALNQGHVHPKILEALITQAAKISLTSRAFRNDQLPHLYKELSDLHQTNALQCEILLDTKHISLLLTCPAQRHNT